ncbi:MAG: hypothetical protein K1X57_07440 [Gemmataceae bacterium]|nr:hypothetical protein [Gemmataceae bacterium]
MSFLTRVYACLSLFVAFGCGEQCSGVVVRGQIVLDGVNLSLAENEAVLLSLIPNQGGPLSGSVGRDGSFIIMGAADGTGVLPGKYKVALQSMLTDREQSTDRFAGHYVAGRTKLEITVSRGMTPVTLAISAK